MSIFRMMTLLTATAAVVFLSITFTSPRILRAEEKPATWWEAETAMGKGGRLLLSNKTWWKRAQALAPGRHFVVKSSQPGGGSMLIRREQWKSRGKTLEAIVCVIDDDGDFRNGDKDGDKDNDCYVADYGADGKVDRMVDYMDNDGNGKPDEMDIRYFVDGCLRRAWFGVDLDKDGHMWVVDQYEYKSNFFLCDAYGNNMIYFNGYDSQRNQWFPASECPFDFHDTDGDGQSEAVVRVSAVPLAYDPQEGVDIANNVNASSAPRSDKTRDMGALNVRYSIDIDGLSSKQRPLHYDLGFNLIGRQPYQYKGMKHTNPLRRAPKTTVCIPHNATRRMAETYPAQQTGFSWREFKDDARQLGFGQLADDDRRWEGIFWTWSRRLMHNTGGPTQTWNMRREFRSTPSTRRELYYSRVDRRIHLKGASEGWIRIGHFGNKKPFGEIRYFDTDKDGYFDRWEVYRQGSAIPLRTSTVCDSVARDLPADWDKLIEFYTTELLPEAIHANEAIMAAMRLVDPDYATPEELHTTLKSSSNDTEKRYIQDIIRECQYQALREKLSSQSHKMLEKPSWESRRIHPSAPSLVGWNLALQLTELDTAYGQGRYKDAVKVLKQIASQHKITNKPPAD